MFAFAYVCVQMSVCAFIGMCMHRYTHVHIPLFSITWELVANLLLWHPKILHHVPSMKDINPYHFNIILHTQKI